MHVKIIFAAFVSYTFIIFLHYYDLLRILSYFFSFLAFMINLLLFTYGYMLLQTLATKIHTQIIPLYRRSPFHRRPHANYRTAKEKIIKGVDQGGKVRFLTANLRKK